MLIPLSRGRKHIRLVTNGFWSRTDDGIDKFINTIEQLLKTCQKVDIAVSTDDWHNPIDKIAIQIIKEKVPEFNLIITGNLQLDDITPVGRAWDNNIVPRGNIQCSCESMSNMTITEDGMISRCPFGYFPWKYFSETTWHDAQDYIWGWRSERLSEGMNCFECMEALQNQNAR